MRPTSQPPSAASQQTQVLSPTQTKNFNEKKDVAQYNKLLAIKKAYENMLLDENITDTKRNAVTLKLQIIESSIKTLKPKINEPESDNRGMEESSSS